MEQEAKDTDENFQGGFLIEPSQNCAHVSVEQMANLDNILDTLKA